MSQYEFAISQIFGLDPAFKKTNWWLIFKENKNGKNIRVLSFRDISTVLQHSSNHSIRKIPHHDSKASYLQIPLHNELQMFFYIHQHDFWTKVKVTFNLEKSILRIEPISKVLHLDREIINQLLNSFALERDNKVTFWYQSRESRSTVQPKEVINQ